MSISDSHAVLDGAVALVTGASKRIGKQCVRQLHQHGYNVAVHYRRSADEATALVAELNTLRDQSAVAIAGELGNQAQAESVLSQAIAEWGQLDVLVNNASSFFPTPVGQISDEQFSNIVSSNLAAPLFMTQAAAEPLAKTRGCVINMIDVHAFKPYANYSVYCSAKSALAMLTRSMALELAPDIRVNGIAPGAILWPEEGISSSQMDDILSQIPLNRQGDATDIANTLVFLASPQARYITGQILCVDGGRSLC